MLHIKKPLYFHFMEYQLPIPLRKKVRKKTVARLKALETV